MSAEAAASGWPDVLTVAPIARARGVVSLPGSKSISNRALLLAALAEGTTDLSRLLDADCWRRWPRARRSCRACSTPTTRG